MKCAVNIFHSATTAAMQDAKKTKIYTKILENYDETKNDTTCFDRENEKKKKKIELFTSPSLTHSCFSPSEDCPLANGFDDGKFKNAIK